VEATGNATAVAEILAPHVARVAVANTLQVHLDRQMPSKEAAMPGCVACPHGVHRLCHEDENGAENGVFSM
jgi:hypothetical protein